MSSHTPWLKYLAMPVGVNLHFLDSGSFSLRPAARKFARKHRVGEFAFYDTPDFWDYVNAYCRFVTRYKVAIDYYSVVDVIPNPERTWQVQQYMEDQFGLNPVPVVHYRTEVRWLERYLNRGHKLISFGGLVGQHSQQVCRDWIDRMFTAVGDDRGVPTARVHGFGVTSWDLLFRYPWWSVDSSSWTKVGGFGGVLVPHKRKGQFDFLTPPYVVKTAYESPERKKPGKHLLTMSRAEQKIIYEWLDLINMPVGRLNAAGELKEVGVINDHSTRKVACLLYFEELRKHLPAWPWAFRPANRATFGITL